jgi:hypothetical protein
MLKFDQIFFSFKYDNSTIMREDETGLPLTALPGTLSTLKPDIFKYRIHF